MPDSLLWINKDTASTVLSRSSKAETREIRKHVQHERQLKAKSVQEAATKSLSPQNRSRRTDKTSASTGTSSKAGSTRCALRLDTNVRDPRPTERALLSAFVSPTTHSSRVLQAISTFPGLNPDELRSLTFFCQRTAPEWSGWRDASFWNRLTLQACHLNRSILHGVVALGALHESSEVYGEPDERTDLQQLALCQSSKASRLACETSVSDIATLISCIIFICLQNLQDSHTAYQLLRSGHSLITDIDARLTSGALTLTDSEKTVLNNVLRPIIERLRMRFCSIVDIPSALALHAACKQAERGCKPPLPQIPEGFKSLLEARNKLEGIIDWAIKHVDPFGAAEAERFQAQLLLSNWIVALDSTATTAVERYDTLDTSKKLLKAAAIIAAILFDTMGTSTECIYDEYAERFAEIVELYDAAIGNPVLAPRKVSFGIDSGVIDTLAFVAGRCRDPGIRRSALRLLTQTNRTEGDLQGCTGSTILQTLINLEEKGLNVSSAGDIPESRRLRIWEDHQYWETGEIRIFFVKWPYDPSMGAEVQQASVYLPVTSLRTSKEKAALGWPRGLPNVKYGRGTGAFLEEGTQVYHHITLSSFFMPMPRL